MSTVGPILLGQQCGHSLGPVFVGRWGVASGCTWKADTLECRGCVESEEDGHQARTPKVVSVLMKLAYMDVVDNGI